MGEFENVSATVIVVSKDNKVLIIQRPSDKPFPNLWAVPGGKLRDNEGIRLNENLLYNSVESCVRRELFEETGVHIWYTPLHYLRSITALRGGIWRLILSYYVVLTKNADEIKLNLSECKTFRWISEAEISQWKFIIDVGGEIREVFARLKANE